MDEKPTSPQEALALAIEICKNKSGLAQALGLRGYQNVQAWQAARVPAEYCPRIERLTDRRVTCESLRPDIDWAYLRCAAETA